MKKKATKPRGETLVRVITGVIFVTFVLYGGMNVLRSLENPFRTARAVSVAVSKASVARGYVVREEAVVAGSGFIVPEIADGVRATSGSVVAMSYGSGADSGTVAQMRELRTRIDRLTSAAGVAAEERAARSTGAVTNLALSLSQRDLTAANDHIIEAESLIMSAVDPESAKNEIAALGNELSALMSQVPYHVAITSPKAGIYASFNDGFEGVSPEDITNLTAAGLDSLFAAATAEAGAGRVITSSQWYLALIVDESAATDLIDLQTVSVRITQPVQAIFNMNVEEVGRSDGTTRVVVLSCSSGMRQILDARSVMAELIFGEVTGIRVPKAAIRIEQISEKNTERTTFVYITEGVQATRVRVEIISEFGDAYIVRGEVVGEEKRGAMSVLRDGTDIIVKANNLYDGKIVR